MRTLPPIFWHALLAAELPYETSRAIVESLGMSSLEPLSALRSWPGLSTAVRSRLDRVDARRVQDLLAKGYWWREGTTIESLAEVPAAPWGLFGRGQSSVLDRPSVAIVGTRQASPYGKACARKFAEHLAEAGWVVLSGGALGIDAQAHEGALAVGGSTVAVLGTGADIVYPAAHGPLYERMCVDGAVVSQFALGTASFPGNFLHRNDVIAALAHVVLVIEAPSGSGALRTAQTAVDLSKPIYVVPGPLSTGRFKGSHGLIRDGATLVDHPGQITEEIGFIDEFIRSPETEERVEGDEAILQFLDETPKLIEELVGATGRDASDLSAAMTLLEMDGLVTRTPSGYIITP
ncbi:MAG: DNA-processing protein DprA [Fimbriimonadaceae bacterium]|nr:DNA-processing protein DprA [Fimbriimonadaceae bacterium]